MAKYTTQIRSIVESGHPLFDFPYPIFDEEYRNVLEQKIIDTYYFREIGLETVGQFKHFLKAKLNRIMPYYNQLYVTEGLIDTSNYNINLDNTITRTTKTDTSSNGQIDNTGNTTASGSVDTTAETLASSDSTSTSEGSSDSTSTGKSDSTSKTDRTGSETGESIFSDTPQAKLQGLDYATNVTDNQADTQGSETTTGSGNATETAGTTTTGSETAGSTATGSEISNSTSGNRVDEVGNTVSTGKLNTIEEYTEHLLGNGSMRYSADILMEWRKSFLNIDQLIIDELQDLFMNIY